MDGGYFAVTDARACRWRHARTQHTPVGTGSMTTAVQARQRSVRCSLRGRLVRRCGTRHVAGPLCPVGVDQAGDTVPAEDPFGLGMALRRAHECSVDSETLLHPEVTCLKAT